MMHVRLSDLSSVGFGLAGGSALMALPMPLGLIAAGSMALASWTMLRMRDGAAPRLPRRGHRSALAPFEGAREFTREPDGSQTPAPANANLTAWQLGRSEFRLAPVTDHVFTKGDQVEFIFDDWDEGDVLYRGVVQESFERGCKVLLDNGLTFFVDRECLVLAEAAQ